MPASGRAAGTISSYKTKARHLVRLLGRDTHLVNVSRDSVQGYIGDRLDEGASRSTVHKELVTLRQSLAEAKKRNRYSGDYRAIVPSFDAGYGTKDAMAPTGRA